MARLSRTDLANALALFGEVLDVAAADERSDDWTMERLAVLVGVDDASYTEWSASSQLLHGSGWPPWDGWRRMTPEEIEIVRAQNPWCRYSERTGDRFFTAIRLTDLVSLREFSGSDLYPLAGYRYGLQARLPGRVPGSHWTIHLARDREFSDRDLQIVDAVRPAFFAYERERRLLVMVEQLRSELHGPKVVDGLSPREHEVLDLVALGATNDDIARELYIAQGTVRKHLENIYRKLNVRSRTAALARSQRTTVHGGHPR